MALLFVLMMSPEIVLAISLLALFLLIGLQLGFMSLLLAFTLSLDDVVVSTFVTGPSYEILSLRIYSMLRVGLKPEINASFLLAHC